MDGTPGLPRGTPDIAAPASVVAPRGQRSTARIENGQKALSKPLAHEAVGDGVAAGRNKGQQVDEVHRHGRDARHRPGVIEHAPRLQHVQRGPAEEKL